MKTIVVFVQANLKFQYPHPLDMAEVLASKGYDVTIVAFFDEETISWNQDRGFSMISLSNMPLGSFFRNVALWVAALRLPSTDIVIGVNTTGYLAAHLMCKLGKARILINYALELSLPEDHPRSFSVWYQSHYLKDANIVLSTGLERAQIMQKRFNLNTLPLVIRNACLLSSRFEVSPLRHKLIDMGFNPPLRLVIHQGVLSEKTCTPQLIESVSSWPDDVALVLIGFGNPDYLARMQQQISLLDVRNKVFFIGDLPGPRKNLLAYTAGADVGLAFRFFHANEILNRIYYTPTKLYDYLAAGLPVVCSANNSLRFVEEERWGICVNPEEPSEIAEAVRAIVHDEMRLRTMSERAQHLFESDYHFEKQMEPLLDHLLRSV